MPTTIEQRLDALEHRCAVLEGANEAWAALFAIRMVLGARFDPRTTLSDIDGRWPHWDREAAIIQLADLQDHKPAAAASARAEGFELVEREIAQAIMHCLPPD